MGPLKLMWTIVYVGVECVCVCVSISALGPLHYFPHATATSDYWAHLYSRFTKQIYNKDAINLKLYTLLHSFLDFLDFERQMQNPLLWISPVPHRERRPLSWLQLMTNDSLARPTYPRLLLAPFPLVSPPLSLDFLSLFIPLSLLYFKICLS